jgi:hypothetical protein
MSADSDSITPPIERYMEAGAVDYHDRGNVVPLHPGELNLPIEVTVLVSPPDVKPSLGDPQVEAVALLLVGRSRHSLIPTFAEVALDDNGNSRKPISGFSAWSGMLVLVGQSIAGCRGGALGVGTADLDRKNQRGHQKENAWPRFSSIHCHMLLKELMRNGLTYNDP